jgi:hypothetical protein
MQRVQQQALSDALDVVLEKSDGASDAEARGQPRVHEKRLKYAIVA